MDWLLQFWEMLTWQRITVGIVLIIISAVVSYGAIIFLLLKLPEDYFSSEYSSVFFSHQPFWIRWTAKVIKNLIGFLLLIAGIIMIFGPGPGLLTILLGIIMLDIPGKRPLEANIIKRPAILAAVNNLRSRYKKPPLVID